MKLLNFACGSRIHPDWVNIDFSPIDKRVKKVNLLRTLPFADESFDVAYSSHFLEHLTPQKALQILKEIKRILKPNGIIRIVVPDLQNLVSAYLATLYKLTNSAQDSTKQNLTGGGGSKQNLAQTLDIANLEFEYDWLMIEMLDQMVRMQSGGQMGECFHKVSVSKDRIKADFIEQRVGERLITPHAVTKPSLKSKITLDKLTNKILNLYLKSLYFLAPRSIRDEVFIRTSIGERHKWAYDSFSLKRLLTQAGFTDIQEMCHNRSQIPHFNTYLLDINADGSAYKGVSSLYMEARA
ncbi:class I SAM-dependent methyltransferase [Helicobacter zhangjianzhongii]|uniref:class I SAM-dependent methyltransferase n=1 Tax=Helicobacter zhangjianzhongii TaxID=2974574 RepID=UPI002557B83B|nr:methyltransferase domain-containing protein [Helicobacter sp. CPD2-1]MDL0080349.1 methyltransferase domain-containing protein [Helicobacter sp. CPD2-1]